MSPEANPTGSGETVAARYVHDQLTKTRATARRVRVVAILLVLVVLGYLSFVVATLKREYLAPRPAAQMVNLQLGSLINQNAPQLTAELKLQIPALISQLPDIVIQQLPALRLAMEDRLEEVLRAYCLKTGDELGSHLDDFLNENKDAIAALVEAGQHPESVAVLGERLEDELKDYLQTKGDDGKSFVEKMDVVLADMQRIEARLSRLATANDLSPDEKKLRLAIAVTMRAAEREVSELTPINVE